MIAIVSLLTILTVSILITKISTELLAHTGLAREIARFQARSAFTGVGFTTSESEKVVHHPIRRRILQILMVLGNAGIVTAMSSLILTFVRDGDQSGISLRIVILVSGLVLLYALASSRWLNRRLTNIIGRALKQFTKLEVHDYASLLHIAGEFRVTELQVQPEDWLTDRDLRSAKLRDEGILVLGITRQDGTYLGAPKASTKILPHDTLILYGRASALERLDQRGKGWAGERDHRQAVAEQKEVIRGEEQEDPAKKEEEADTETR
jgi:hypothetical protein